MTGPDAVREGDGGLLSLVFPKESSDGLHTGNCRLGRIGKEPPRKRGPARHRCLLQLEDLLNGDEDRISRITFSLGRGEPEESASPSSRSSRLATSRLIDCRRRLTKAWTSDLRSSPIRTFNCQSLL